MARRRRRRGRQVSWETALSWLGAILLAAGKPAVIWVGRNAGRAVVHVALTGAGAVVTGSQLVRSQAREYGEHGRTMMVTCGCCGERMPITEADEHLAAADSAPAVAARPAIPAGARRLALAQRPDVDVLPGPRRRRAGWPRVGELMCPHCKDWVGPQRAWPLHAEHCAEAQAAKQAHRDRQLRWLHYNLPSALTPADHERIAVLRAERPLNWGLPSTAPDPATTSSPSPTGGGASTTQNGSTDMDVRPLIRHLEVLANPELTTQNWETELPAAIGALQAFVASVADRVGGDKASASFGGYLIRGGMPSEIVLPINNAAQMIADAVPQIAEALRAAEQHIADQRQREPFANAS